MTELALKTKKIKMEFYPTHAPSSTDIYYKNGIVVRGFFHDCNDGDQLLEKQQCRFVLHGSAIAFRDAKDEQERIKNSVIVDFTEVQTICLTNMGVTLKTVHLN